ncbi:MAG: sigma-70 family RNA polymerase sigma factor, partial [Planctomycetota bacterium]
MDTADRQFESFAKRGDITAFGKVYDATAAKLMKIAARLVRDAGEAEELVQQTFIAAIEAAESFEAGRRVEPWLAGILSNRIKRWRQTRRAVGGDEGVASDASRSAPDTDDPAQQAAAHELRATLHERIDALTEPYRSVAALHLLNGLDPADVAYALDRAPATVRSQLMRAKRQLRAALPAGMFVAALAVPATRGIAAVKASVLPHAQAYAASLATAAAGAAAGTAATSSASTLLLGKWLGALAAAALLIAGATLLLRSGAETTLPPLAGQQPTAAARSVAEPSAEGAATIAHPRAAAGESSELSIHAASRQAAPQGKLGQLVVHVEDKQGKALPCVVVHLFNQYKDWSKHYYATSDDEGCARFDNIPAGQWQIFSTCDAMVSWTKIEPQSRAEATLTANTPPFWLFGTVVTPRTTDAAGGGGGSGGPVEAKSTVWLCGLPSKHNRVVNVVEVSPDGAFRIPLWSISMVGVQRDGCQPCHRVVVPKMGGAANMQFRLTGGGASLHATILTTGERAAPIPNVEVTLLEDPSGLGAKRQDGSHASSVARTSYTDQQGRFELDGLTPGPVRLRLESQGRAPKIVDLELSPGDPQPIELRMGAGGTVAGVFTDAEGNPLAHTSVHLANKALQRTIETRADATGRFRLEHLPEGPIVIRANTQRPKQGGEQGVDDLIAQTSTAVAEGEVQTWSPQLTKKADTIAGTVRDERGAPLRDWFVSVELPGVNTRSAATDTDGRFAIGALRSSTALHLYVHPPGERDSRGKPRTVRIKAMSLPATALGTPVEIVVADADIPTAWLRGRVERGDRWQRRRRPFLFLQSDDGGSRRRLRTPWAEDGSFAAGPLPPGTWRIEIEPHVISSWLPTRHRLLPRQSLDIGTITPPAAGTLQVALDPGQAKQRGGGLKLHFFDPDRGSSTTESVWRAEHEWQLPPGRIQLQLVDAAFAPEVHDVVIAPGRTTKLQLALKPSATVPVRFEMPFGHHLLDSNVTLRAIPASGGTPIMTRSLPRERTYGDCWFVTLKLP